MSNKALLLAIDQGTSGTKTVVFDTQGRIVAKATEPLASSFPLPGYVEQDPLGIYHNVLASVKACLTTFQEKGGDLGQIKSCGLSNQRETFVLWDKHGKPLSNAIVWQCKRSVDICKRLKNTALEAKVKQRTGLIIDPYFSGTKLLWLYENDPCVRQAIDAGQACFGTVDTWLLYQLTQGRHYLTDYTNASRTLFFNLDELQWDRQLLNEFGMDRLCLPECNPSASWYGITDFAGLLARAIPIGAMIGDSHAAAFGEGCFVPGTAKATLGTGCSILLNTGASRCASQQGMVTTICWSTSERVDYALEGIIVTCGATVNWLRDSLDLFAHSTETQAMAQSVTDNRGVYLVPAFSGLGAPHWHMDLKAAITGLTFGCNKNHLVRAALESIAYQIKDVIAAMEQDSPVTLQSLKVDGGISTNGFVMQFLADLLGTSVVNMGIADVSALGAANLAGLQQGVFSGIDQLVTENKEETVFRAKGESCQSIQTYYEGWTEAIRQLT